MLISGTHDFFLNRDYPPVDNLQQVFRALGEEAQPMEKLREKSSLSEEEFEKALEKLRDSRRGESRFQGGPR